MYILYSCKEKKVVVPLDSLSFQILKDILGILSPHNISLRLIMAFN